MLPALSNGTGQVPAGSATVGLCFSRSRAGMLGWDVGLGCWAGIDPLVDDRFRTQASCEGELAGKEMHLGFGA